ncbi:MAG: hypothetical protein HOW73_41430 [Polyangiaceae bacterium]|nr:hypothetical protein [Polyangiaceae bacterium]
MSGSTPLECRHPHDLGIEEELAIAERARAEGDWKHALHHYLNALRIDPLAAQAVAAVRQLRARSEVLGALEGNDFLGAHVARCYLFADDGRRDEAVGIIAQVDDAMPELGAAALLLEWFDPAAPSKEARGALIRRLARVASFGVGRLRLLPGEKAAIEPYAELAARIAETEEDPTILGLASGLLRRADRCEEALAIAERAAKTGSSNARIALALAHRAAGRPAVAAQIFHEIHETSKDPIYLVEMARALAESGRYSEARRAIERVEALTGVEGDLETKLLLEWIAGRAAGDEAALARDYDWVRRQAMWHGAILEMRDASTNMLDDPRAQRGAAMTVSVSGFEAPSARLCLAIHQGAGPNPRAVKYSYSDVPTPDPRVPRRKVETLLWAARDGVMEQAVPPPATEVVAVVAEVAAETVDLFACWETAGRLAPKIREHLADVAAAMVYPPEPPASTTSVKSWLFHCQMAAACLIARAESRWAGSERRRILLDLVRGPSDWSTAAAVLALGEIAVREPSALPEIRRELIALAETIPETCHCPYGATLAVTATKVPLFRAELAQALQATWLTGSSDDIEDQPAPERAEPDAPAAEAASEPAKKPWWKFW